MNKPKKIKVLTKIEDSFCDNLLKIFDTTYDKEPNKLYERDKYFIGVDCDFTINRFKVENKEKLNQFIEISKHLLSLLENSYGFGKIWNLQIAKMKGGGIIYPHMDSGLGFVFSHRIHIPLITNENVIFKVDNSEFYLKRGYAYELNNLEEHSVYNKNNVNHNRIHLILDYMSNEYLQFYETKNKTFKKVLKYK
jgi:hypothetical protein